MIPEIEFAIMNSLIRSSIERLPLPRMTRTANRFFPLLSAEDDSLASMVFDSMAGQRGASNFSLGKLSRIN